MLGQTLTGVNVPVVLLGKHEEGFKKPVILISGRIHPGESNGSLVVNSLMRFIIDSSEAKYLR